MKVDGIRVANDGSIPFRAGERVALKYYMSQLFPEDEVGGAGGYVRSTCQGEIRETWLLRVRLDLVWVAEYDVRALVPSA